MKQMHLRAANSVLFLTYVHLICSLNSRQSSLKHETKQKKKKLPVFTNSTPVSSSFLCRFLWFSSRACPSSLLFSACCLLNLASCQPQFQFQAANILPPLKHRTQENTMQRTDIIYGYEGNYQNIMKVESFLEVKFCNFHVISRR